MVGRFALSLLLVTCLGVTGCEKLFPKPKPKPEVSQPAPAVKGTIVAQVGNIPITKEDLEEEIIAVNKQTEDPKQKITTRQQKLDYLRNTMVQRVLLYLDGVSKGLDRSDDVVQALNKFKMELVVAQRVRQESQQLMVTDADIKAFYDQYKEVLREPEERQIREIMVPTEQEAKDILIQLLQGADFAQLARDHSKAPTAANGGDLGFIPPSPEKSKKSLQFLEAAFSTTLDVGKTTNVFNGGDGFYILKLEEKRGGKQLTLDDKDTKELIRARLTLEKQSALFKKLMGSLSQQYKTEIFDWEIK